MTFQELSTFLLSRGQGAATIKQLQTLIPALVGLNSILFEALNCEPNPDEPASAELIALATLTSELYGLRNDLQTRLGDETVSLTPIFVKDVTRNKDDSFTLTTNYTGFKLLSVAEAAEKK